MRFLRLLYHHPHHRARQLRWVVPPAVVLLGAALVTLAVQYHVSDEAVGTEFFRAHKTISHTGQLLRQGTLLAGAVLIALVVIVALWALRLTHRIVRPVHTLHRALDELVAGDLGVRVELHRTDEFEEVATALNRLVDEFSAVLADVHGMVDRIVDLARGEAANAHAGERLRTEAALLDRKIEFFRLGPERVIRADVD